MPSAKFDVTPEEIAKSATKVEEKTTAFTKAYESIYTAVEDLRMVYRGEASDTFNQRIQAYQNDFTKAEKVLKNYVNFLRTYSEDVKRKEGEIQGMAAKLPSGN